MIKPPTSIAVATQYLKEGRKLVPGYPAVHLRSSFGGTYRPTMFRSIAVDMVKRQKEFFGFSATRADVTTVSLITPIFKSGTITVLLEFVEFPYVLIVARLGVIPPLAFAVLLAVIFPVFGFIFWSFREHLFDFTTPQTVGAAAF